MGTNIPPGRESGTGNILGGGERGTGKLPPFIPRPVSTITLSFPFSTTVNVNHPLIAKIY
jgi:hypothetical protein